MQGRIKVPSMPLTDSVASRTFQLPFFNQLTEQQIDLVCEKLETALAGIG